MDAERTDEPTDALLAALEADEEDEREGEDPTPRDVRSVLEEIGAEEAVAHLEARVAGLEQELERRDARQREADRARRGETDLMRARIEDALELVRSSMDEQRDAWSRFETRFAEMVSASEETARAHIDELREELTPRVEAAVLRLEESEAQLRGELRSVADTHEERREDDARELAELREDLAGQLRTVRERVDEQVTANEETTGRLERLLEQRLANVGAAAEAATGELRDDLAGLRRELDSAVGELRAALSLRSSDLEDRLAEAREESAERLSDEVESLEQRWIEGTRDIARRIEQVQRELNEQLVNERESRRSTDDELGSRLDEVTGVVEDLQAAAGNGEARRHADDEQVRRELDEISGRLDVLQSKVASAVGQIASQLTNRVATLSAEQTALREAAVRREERLGALDALESRVAELGRELEQLEQAGPRPADADARRQLDRSVGELRQQVAGLAGTLEGANERLVELGSAVERVAQEQQERAALRHEVRELTARSAELAERLEETERLARAAGKAIASAVRRSRSAKQHDTSEPLFFRPEPSEPTDG